MIEVVSVNPNIFTISNDGHRRLAKLTVMELSLTLYRQSIPTSVATVRAGRSFCTAYMRIINVVQDVDGLLYGVSVLAYHTCTLRMRACQELLSNLPRSLPYRAYQATR